METSLRDDGPGPVIAAGPRAPARGLMTPFSATGAVVCGLVIATLLLWGSTFQVYVGGLVVIYAIAAIGLEWLMGRAGQVSLGNAALMAIGGYTTAIIAPKSWAPFPLPLIASAVVGGIIGLVIALPALRLHGIYLALATLALHFITQFTADRYQEHTGEISGLSVKSPTFGPFDFAKGDGRSMLVLLTAVLVIVVALLANLYRHSPGRLWMSIKESELGASALGVNVTLWKTTAFVGSSAVVAIAGSLLAYYTKAVSYETYSLEFAIGFLVMVIIGGSGSMGGAIVGAALVTVAPYALKALSDLAPDDAGYTKWLDKNIFYLNNGLYGVFLLVFLLYRPNGLAPALRDGIKWIAKKTGVGRTAVIEAEPDPTVIEDQPRETVLAPSAGPTGVPVLRVENLRVQYNTGARAVDGVDLVVPASQIVALLGRNGAGKTSTLRSIGGFFVAERASVEGSIVFGGKALKGMSPTQRSRLGVALVPERDKVFPSITTADHLRLAAPKGQVRDEVFDVFPALAERASSPAGLLSGGERQMLAMAMAWLLQPKLLLVDELSLGLAPVIIRDLLSKLAEISARDEIAVLLVEQNATAALSIAHYAYVLDSGVLVGQGTPAELHDQDALAAAYIGGRA